MTDRIGEGLVLLYVLNWLWGSKQIENLVAIVQNPQHMISLSWDGWD